MRDRPKARALNQQADPGNEPIIRLPKLRLFCCRSGGSRPEFMRGASLPSKGISPDSAEQAHLDANVSLGRNWTHPLSLSAIGCAEPLSNASNARRRFRHYQSTLPLEIGYSLLDIGYSDFFRRFPASDGVFSFNVRMSNKEYPMIKEREISP